MRPLDNTAKQRIVDACKEGHFDEAITLLTATIPSNDLIVSANLFSDPERTHDGKPALKAINLDHAPDKPPGEPGSPNLYYRPSVSEMPTAIPAKIFKPRSIHLMLTGCVVKPKAPDSLPALMMTCSPEGDVYITIINANITGDM